MKKIILLTGLFIGVANLAMSQLFVIEPNDTLNLNIPANTLTIGDIYQRNISAGIISLSYVKIYESIPFCWTEYSLCDKGACIPGLPLSGTMDTVGPTPNPNRGFLALNVNPESFAGILTLRYYVYEDSEPSNGDTVTFIYSAATGTACNASVENISAIDFNIFPNPTTDFIILKPLSNMTFPAQIAIYDLNGKVLIRRNNIQENEAIDVSHLSVGNYILEVENNYLIRKPFVKK